VDIVTVTNGMNISSTDLFYITTNRRRHIAISCKYAVIIESTDLPMGSVTTLFRVNTISRPTIVNSRRRWSNAPPGIVRRARLIGITAVVVRITVIAAIAITVVIRITIVRTTAVVETGIA
jgi:hypothetical protein